MSKLIRKVLARTAGSKESSSITDTNTLSLEDDLPRERVGLFDLSNDNDDKSIDVVAVHGLRGDAFKTWEHENGSNWLKDFLPADIPSARIMAFGYEFSKSFAKLEDKSLELLNCLSAKRNETGRSLSGPRPIVFICHDVGGILVKKALILAHECPSDPDYKDILDNSRAIVFLGVPHNGIDSSYWATLGRYTLKGARLGRFANTALMADLQKNSKMLIDISKQFVHRGKDLKIYTFYETQRLRGVVVCTLSDSNCVRMTNITYLQLVNELSARIGAPNERLFPVEANHRNICKMPAKESPIYHVVGVWTAKLVKTIIRENVPRKSQCR